MSEEKRHNPFWDKNYPTPHQTPPFHLIDIADYEPAMMEGMRRDKEFIERIVNNPDVPTFDNTIAVTATDDMLERVSKVFFCMLSAETNDELDALAQRMSPLLTQHANDIIFNRKYFERVQKVYEHHRELTPEEQMLLDNCYDGFVRAGAALPPEKQELLRQMNMELSALTLQFSQNTLKDNNAFTLHITDRRQLAGLPDTAIEAASMAASERELEGWVFTLQAPSYGPFMTYASDRDLRRQMYIAKNTICTHGDEHDNRQLVTRIVNLRRERAQLLGYDCYADFVMAHRMAGCKENVFKLIDKLLDAYMPAARRELSNIEEMARQMEGDDFKLQPWDFSFYAHKLKMKRWNIDAEMLRPYFQLERVKEGVFSLATRLYGITFHERKDIPVYHPDVTAYDVIDEDGTFLAVLFTDFHPRTSKQSGAWMTSFKDQWIGPEEGCADPTDQTLWKNSRPQVSLVMNLTKPTPTKPALLTLGEVETFLHEFGHALHGIFANTRFASLSGTNVYWDFVELPSQLMENFATQPEWLATFACHYESGEPLPADLVERIVASNNFNVAYACIRQLSFCLLDMAYYTLTEPFEGDVREFERQAWSRAQLFDEVPEACMSVQFGHIMAGGYAAGYYSYKWAEVLDADAFSLFKQNGIFDRKTAQSFRDNILSRGGTEHPMTLYRRFRGQEPTIDALLQRNGITHN